jgi:3',5'-cyclic-nucleotide phosphodiesterase
MILTDEFARQASMEEDLGIKSTLFAVPTREMMELAKSQLGFMNMFAIPLFQGVTDVMPAMQFCVDELLINKSMWESRVREEQERMRTQSEDSLVKDGYISPRHLSLADEGSNGSSSTARGPANHSTHEGSTRSSLGPDGILGQDGLHYSASELNESAGASPSASLTSPTSTMTPGSSGAAPSNVQLSYATSSALELLDQTSENHLADQVTNGNVKVEPSLVTDTVVKPPDDSVDGRNLPRISVRDHAPQRSSDTTTDASNTTPGSGDWASQATSATTSKVPYSPSTQGTSVMSGDSDPSPNFHTEISSPPASRGSLASRRPRSGVDKKDGNGVAGVVNDTKRTLRTKASRFRLTRFWRGRGSSANRDRERSSSAHREAALSASAVSVGGDDERA